MWIDSETDQDPYNRQGNNINNPNNQSSVGSGGGSGPVAGGTNAPSGSNPSTVNPVESNKTQNFATVQDYLKGNQQQGEALAGKVTGKLDTDLSNEKGAIDQSAGNVKNQIQSATPTYDSNLTNQALNDPTKVTNDPGKLNSFLAQWNASYSGPQNFEGTADYSKAAGAKNEADTRKAEVGSAGGQQQLLHDDFGVYGQGNQGLDQAVLQNSSKYGDVMGYGSKFGGIGDYLKSQSANVNSQAANAQVAADLAKQNTRAPFANNLTDFQNTLDTNVAASKQQVQSADKYKKDLASGDQSPILADLNKAGIPKDQTSSIANYLAGLNQDYGSNPDLSNYYTFNPNTDISRQTVATPEDYAKAKAWQQLTGTDYSSVLNPADASKANTWNGVNSGFQTDNIASYLKNSLSQQDQELLKEPDLSSVFSKLKAPNLFDATVAGNPADGSHVAQSLIDATNRTGKSSDSIAKLSQYQKQAEDRYNQLMLNAPYKGPAGGKANTLAGLATFVRTLSSATGVPSSLGSPIASKPPTPPTSTTPGIIRAF